MFRTSWRLTRKRDLERVYRQGVSAGSRHFFIRALTNRPGEPRFTVIIGKKVAKKAVVRNRLKRLARQAISELYTEGVIKLKAEGKDIIVTIHRDPAPEGAPSGHHYELLPIKKEVATCFARLP